MAFDIGILTISDRASSGEYQDKSGPLIRQILASRTKWQIAHESTVRDNVEEISAKLIEWSNNHLNLILTTGGTGFAINTGMSGAWFNLADRNGEGFLPDFGNNAAGDVIVIVSIYSFDSMGNQAWMIGSGVADGNEVVADLIIGEDNNWGDDFVSGGTTETPFGTVTFTFSSCTAGHISVAPNMDMEGRGFSAIEYDVSRDLTLHETCPIAD